MTQLTRRDFLRLCGASSIGLTLAACGVTPTATSVPVATAVATATMLPTSTPTNSATPAATRTNTPTATPRPTEVPRPQVIIFQDDFNNGKFNIGIAYPDRWDTTIHEYGTKVDIVPDPLNSIDAHGNPRGNVMRVTVQGNPVLLPSWGPGYWRAGYPSWHNFTHRDGLEHLLQESAGLQVDMLAPSDVGTFSALGGHRLNIKTGDTNSVAAIEIHNNNQVVVLGRDGSQGRQGGDTRVTCLSGLYKPGEWNTFTVIVDSNKGRVLPYINGVFALQDKSQAPTVPIGAEHPGSFSDGHAGINVASPTTNEYINRNAIIYNDNFIVFKLIE